MALSPMMQQYFMLKEKYPDTVLLFRLGDFYEMFFDDAEEMSRVLELTLTQRDCGLEKRAPMCGVPYHAVDNYINKLIEAGYKVAICEQLTDPKVSKGLVERDVVRVITAGTLTERSMLQEKKNNYICAVVYTAKTYGIAWADISTGEFCLTETPDAEGLNDTLAFVKPNELLLSTKNAVKTKKPLCVKCCTSKFNDVAFVFDNAKRSLCRHFDITTLDCFDCGDMNAGICAAGGLLEYLKYTQKADLAQILTLSRHKNERYLMMDTHTRRNLELTQPMNGRGKKGTLLWVLDRTRTAMGGRMLAGFLERPIRSKAEIERRLDGVEELVGSYGIRTSLSEALLNVYDVERISTKVAYGSVNPRDCLSLAQSLHALPGVKGVLSGAKSAVLKEAGDSIDEMPEIADLLSRAIDPDAAAIITDGGIIRDGYDAELDRLRDIKRNSAGFIAGIEARERERTGIKTLKVGYNRVFGYYIEISKSFAHMAPVEYERKQTLAGGERFVTAELKELEKEILGVSDRIIKLEYELFCAVREKIRNTVKTLHINAGAVALADTLLSFAEIASENSYVRPMINEEGRIEIRQGRHPVVEAVTDGGRFVPNDTLLDTKDNRLMIITGPNMAGKSTYMRQVAMITLLTHIGCFVPADYADICITDRIFTRIGASDDLVSGQSTFMLEMNEVATILHNCTRNSLVVLDEIGRGTSTFDGLSIAWAVAEHMADSEKAGCKTMFATHYHELSELEGRLDGVKNYCIQVREHGEDVIFLRKILRGSADKSFGIAVARLAGVPKDVLRRAKEILGRLEEADISKKQISANILGAQDNYGLKNAAQLSLMADPISQEIVDTLKETDINELTPVAALNLICELREKARRG